MDWICIYRKKTTQPGDPTLLHQIFANILENALKYRKKDVPLRVEVASHRHDDDEIVSITDNGIGIAPEHHARIFEVFQRLHTDDEYDGTGIGLATVKKSVEKLGGDVWVESEEGKGSTFCVRLHGNETARSIPSSPPPGQMPE